MPDIVISEFMDEAAIARSLSGFDVLYDASLVDRPDDLAAAVRGARALIVRNRTQVRGALLEAADALVCVGRLGVGLDNIDVSACGARGVKVFPATGANDIGVAEYVIGTAMMLMRGAYTATDAAVAGEWPRNRLMGREVYGKTLGLIGFGSIAKETGKRAAALGMTVVAYDPFVAADDAAWSQPWGTVAKLELDALLAESDVVSLHVPLTEKTKNLIDADALARCKPAAIVINAARGGVVDEPALAAALKDGRLGGAALDVFETEPLSAQKGAVFAGCPNLVLTPHIAGVSVESNVRVSAVTAENVRRALTEV